MENYYYSAFSFADFLAWEPDASVSSCFICSGKYVWQNSYSDRFPSTLAPDGPITAIYWLWGGFDTMTDRGASSDLKSHLFRCSDWLYRLMKHEWHCQSRQCWSNVNQSCVTASPVSLLKYIQKHILMYRWASIWKRLWWRHHLIYLKTDQEVPQIASAARRYVKHFVSLTGCRSKNILVCTCW